jgi:hypothetical protein
MSRISYPRSRNFWSRVAAFALMSAAVSGVLLKSTSGVVKRRRVWENAGALGIMAALAVLVASCGVSGGGKDRSGSGGTQAAGGNGGGEGGSNGGGGAGATQGAAGGAPGGSVGGAGTGGQGGAGPGGSGMGAQSGGGGDSVTCPVAPAGEMVVSVAGTWTFTPAGAAATTIDVPAGGWVAQGFRVSAARYERAVTIPDLGRPQATYLALGAVNHQATLSIDGSAVGTNTTSFTPSIFDMTAVVRPGASQRLAIDVKGRDALHSSRGKKLVPDAAGWSANVPQGIFRSAALRVVPALHVSDAFVRTDVAADKISVDVWVKNDGSATANGTVAVALSSWTCDALSYPTLPPVPVSVPRGTIVKATIGPVTWGLGPSSYWWPNVPYTQGYRAKLHNARVTVTPDAAGGGGAALHAIPIRFGFRQSRQVGAHYELNGVRVNFRGDNLQGADYDSVKTAKDVSDAYDLLPGFLPPTVSNPGWPAAVDNYERLNYNVNRIHQEPASPYMLDVADEMGLMIIDETAIRGSNNDQDFIDGRANMLSHADALVRRDRNHPAVIRWSQANEAEYESTNSNMFQLQLYQAIMAADDTRPVSADSAHAGTNFDASYTAITASNFSAFEHYPGGLGIYTEQVRTSTTRPFGVGEYIWPKDQTAQGFMWFATATMAMRQTDASDLRPYTLLSAWASVVPGIRTTMMKLEPTFPAGIISSPLFGEDNLPDPWSNPTIVRIQRAMNPMAVADVAYWNANRMSNSTGAWPAAVETVSSSARLSRQLVVFNDALAGTAVDVSWEMHQGTAGGPIADQGSMILDIPPGQRAMVTIAVTAPATGTSAVLVLQSSKDGRVLFRDDAQQFALQ